METRLTNNSLQRDVIVTWLNKYFLATPFTFELLPEHASFRRYYRVYSRSDSYILMLAPANEKPAEFCLIADFFQANQLLAPKILAKELSLGLILMTDMGNKTLLAALKQNLIDEKLAYQNAISILLNLQRLPKQLSLPIFDQQLLNQEWQWHQEWFFEKYLQKKIPAPLLGSLNEAYALLVAQATSQSQIFMHRDFHADNLMLSDKSRIAVLDFQDAFYCPLTYDLVSLLKDCYHKLSPNLLDELCAGYWQASTVARTKSYAEFRRDFDFMGVQRHIKALFTFARKCLRDNAWRYAQFMPLTLDYIVETCSGYPELATMGNVYANLKDQLKELDPRCVE